MSLLRNGSDWTWVVYQSYTLIICVDNTWYWEPFGQGFSFLGWVSIFM